ncbi:MAG: hypothetical protein WCP86_12275 [bacterium]
MNTRTVLTVGVCVATLVTCSAGAAGLETSGDVSATVASSYVWRGKEINDDAVVQPQIALCIDKWTLTAWGTWDVIADEGSSARTRVDVQVDYGIDWKRLMLKGGAVVRAYHDDPAGKATDTYEVYAQVAASDLEFSPSLTVYYDFGTIDGVYASLAAGDAMALREWIDLAVDVRLGVGSDGFNRRFFGKTSAGTEGDAGIDIKGGLVDISASLSFPIVHKELVITPKLEFSTLIDSALRDAAVADDRKADSLSGSISVAWAF